MGSIKIHKFEQMHQSYLKRLNGMDISDRNKEIVNKFKDSLLLEGLSKARVVNYLRFFVFLFKFIKKDLDKVTNVRCQLI